MQLDNHYLVGDRRTTACSCCRRSSTAMPNPDALPPRRQRRARTAGRRAAGAGERAASARHAGPVRDRRPARPALDAAGDLLHLQPQPVRRSGAGMCRRRRAAHRPPSERRASARSSTRSARRVWTTPTSPCSATGSFVAQLEAGVAPHHAGMVPPFKEVVEACFIEGLVKVVFATETLAVGDQHAGADAW